MKKGLSNRRTLREKRFTWSLVITFPFSLPSQCQKEGLSEAVIWGRLGLVLCYIGGTTRPVIAGEKKIYKIYDSNQSGLALLYIQLSVLFSHSFRVVSIRG